MIQSTRQRRITRYKQLENLIKDASQTITENIQGGISEYWINTGQTEQKVKYTSMIALENLIDKWKNELEELAQILDPCYHYGRGVGYVR